MAARICGKTSRMNGKPINLSCNHSNGSWFDFSWWSVSESLDTDWTFSFFWYKTIVLKASTDDSRSLNEVEDQRLIKYRTRLEALSWVASLPNNRSCNRPATFDLMDFCLLLAYFCTVDGVVLCFIRRNSHKHWRGREFNEPSLDSTRSASHGILLEEP